MDLQGKIMLAEFDSTTSNGKWDRYNFSLESGETFKAVVPHGQEVAKGDELSFKKGQYGYVLLTKGGSNGSAGKKGGGSSYNDGQLARLAYEKDSRDPKIEYQFYFDHVQSAYLQKIEVKNTKDLDAMFEYVRTKAQDILTKVASDFSE